MLDLEILNLFPTEFYHKGIFNITFKACQCMCAEAKVTRTVFKMQRKSETRCLKNHDIGKQTKDLTDKEELNLLLL